MTVRDFVMIAAGEIILALTFGLGILVGCSVVKRKETQHGNDDGR